MACVVAHYLQTLAPESERKDTVNASDVKGYFIQGGFPLPKRPEQLLLDAKGAGYFDSAKRGAYRLNPVGHNLVVHQLPRPAAAAPSGPTRRPKPRKRSKPHKTPRRNK